MLSVKTGEVKRYREQRHLSKSKDSEKSQLEYRFSYSLVILSASESLVFSIHCMCFRTESHTWFSLSVLHNC